MKLPDNVPVNPKRLPFWLVKIEDFEDGRSGAHGWVMDQFKHLTHHPDGTVSVDLDVRIGATHVRLAEWPWEGRENPLLVGWEGGRVVPVSVTYPLRPMLPTDNPEESRNEVVQLLLDLSNAVDLALS